MSTKQDTPQPPQESRPEILLCLLNKRNALPALRELVHNSPTQLRQYLIHNLKRTLAKLGAEDHQQRTN